MRLSLGVLWVLVSLCSCSESSSTPTCAGVAPRSCEPAWFEEQARQRGVSFVYHSGHQKRHRMPEIMGGGAALFDMDNDGDLDIYLVQGGSLLEPADARPPNQLFRNLGDGMFQDVTEGSGAGEQGYGMGVACGDYDNDGDVDLYITNYGANVLLENDGSGRFEDVTERAGVGHPGWSTSAAFLDWDDDGDLDLFVCSYLDWSPDLELECFNTMGGADYCSPRNYLAPAQDRLYRNNGDGTFADVTKEAGLETFSGTGLGVVAGDFTGDGRVDLFVANDGMRDQLWVNQGSGFLDASILFGCGFDQDGRAAAGMGVTAADVDDDGDLDLMVGNLRNESDSFFLNEGGRFFTNRTAAVGLAATSRRFTRFGMAWHDFDNDGFLDLYQANGRVMREAELHGRDPYAEPNLLFRGRQERRFQEVSPRGGTRELLIGTSRAAAFGDLNNDGGIDVLVVNREGDVALLINLAAKQGHWIAFRVVDDHGRDAYGATVQLTIGERRVLREVRAAYSYLASNDPRVYFGLAEHTRIGDLKVRWPDGSLEDFGGRAADQIYTVRRGQGRHGRSQTRRSEVKVAPRMADG